MGENDPPGKGIDVFESLNKLTKDFETLKASDKETKEALKTIIEKLEIKEKGDKEQAEKKKLFDYAKALASWASNKWINDEGDDFGKIIEGEEVLEQYTPKAYGPPPKYPPGLYPLPKLTKLMEKLCKEDETVKACVARLQGTKEAEAPKTKEECEKAGGTWNEETKTCKLEKEATEGVKDKKPPLPSSKKEDNMDTDVKKAVKLLRGS